MNHFFKFYCSKERYVFFLSGPCKLSIIRCRFYNKIKYNISKQVFNEIVVLRISSKSNRKKVEDENAIFWKNPVTSISLIFDDKHPFPLGISTNIKAIIGPSSRIGTIMQNIADRNVYVRKFVFLSGFVFEQKRIRENGKG